MKCRVYGWRTCLHRASSNKLFALLKRIAEIGATLKLASIVRGAEHMGMTKGTGHRFRLPRVRCADSRHAFGSLFLTLSVLEAAGKLHTCVVFEQVLALLQLEDTKCIDRRGTSEDWKRFFFRHECHEQSELPLLDTFNLDIP